MNCPFISVVLPSYNSSHFVKQAVASIIGQSFSRFELLIVDDASTDDTREKLARFADPRIIKINLETNCGYPTAINRALEIAKGRYVARMDADDIAHPDRLRQQFEFLEKHPDYGFVGTRFEFITPNDLVYVRSTNGDSQGIEETWATAISGRKYADATVMFRKNLGDRVGMYRTYQNTGQDIDLWLRMLETGCKAATINAPLYFMRLHFNQLAIRQKNISAQNQIPRILAKQRKQRGRDQVMDGLGVDDLLSSTDVSNAFIGRFQNLWYCAELCARAGDRRSSAHYVAEAVLMFPFDPKNLLRIGALMRKTLKVRHRVSTQEMFRSVSSQPTMAGK